MKPYSIEPPEINLLKLDQKAMDAYGNALRELTDRYCERVESLTREQFMDVLEQMILSGDFVRYVQLSTGSQRVVYHPYAEKARLEARISELEQRLSGKIGADSDVIGEQ